MADGLDVDKDGILDVDRDAIRDTEIKEFTAAICASFETFKTVCKYKLAKLDLITTIDTARKWQDDVRMHIANDRLGIEPVFIEVALLIHWIVKSKPIFLSFGQSDPKLIDKKYYGGEYNAVNEYYAFWLGINCISCHIPLDYAKIDQRVRDIFVFALYNFNAEPQHLLLPLKLLCESAPAASAGDEAQGSAVGLNKIRSSIQKA